MSAKKIAVIDYGMGNLHSVASALAKVAPDYEISVTSDQPESAVRAISATPIQSRISPQ